MRHLVMVYWQRRCKRTVLPTNVCLRMTMTQACLYRNITVVLQILVLRGPQAHPHPHRWLKPERAYGGQGSEVWTEVSVSQASNAGANRFLSVNTSDIEVSAESIRQELQYDITELETRVNRLEAAASSSGGLPVHLPVPPLIVIEDAIPELPLLLLNFRQTYLDAINQWTSHVRDALGTFELVVNGLDQGLQELVQLDQRDLIALPPGETLP